MQFDTNVSVDADDFIQALSYKEKRAVVLQIQTQLAEEPVQEFEDSDLLELCVEPTVNVSVDVSDASSWERESIYEDLHDEFGEECECDEPATLAETLSGRSYFENELGSAMFKIWEDRHLLTPSQRERIIAITKEKYV